PPAPPGPLKIGPTRARMGHLYTGATNTKATFGLHQAIAGALASLLLLSACAAPAARPAPTSTTPVATPPLADAIATPPGSEKPSIALSLAPSPAPSSAASPSPGVGVPLAQLLAMLATAPEHRAGYDRSLFRHWIDADLDGCDTRREVLIAEAILPPIVGGGCSLTGGMWLSAYDGLAFSDPIELEIDHVVALAEAWDSGAYAWSPERREGFANDLGVTWALIAVSAASNRSKSDRDPADWVPPSASDLCPFVSAWIAVKVRWQLTVDDRERTALESLIAECPASRMPAVVVTTMVEPSVAPLPIGTACSPAYPTVCIPPPPPDLDCGQIPYRRFIVLAPDPHHFDGDGDGIGCEG
ncbi:MAG: HNH endonuclease family protein, partial [Candidatus Limnocylindria bacterium]